MPKTISTMMPSLACTSRLGQCHHSGLKTEDFKGPSTLAPVHDQVSSVQISLIIR